MNYKEKLEAIKLISFSDDQAVNWLENNALKVRPSWLSDVGKPRLVAEYLWYRRNNRSLTLALAKYGANIHILKRIYSEKKEIEWEGIPYYSIKKPNTNKLQKIAVLTNACVGPDEGYVLSNPSALNLNQLFEILKDYPKSKDLFEAYFTNPHIPRDLLSAIIKREENFNFINNDLLLEIVIQLSKNPIISQKHESIYMDGWAEYSYNKLFYDLLKLLSDAPVNPSWAYVLSEIVKNINIPTLDKEINLELLKRWKAEDEKGGHSKSYNFYLRYETAKVIFQNAHDKRKETISANHEDKAVRLAYYATCKPYDIFGTDIYRDDFEYPSRDSYGLPYKDLSESTNSVLKKCKECFKRDGNEFVEGLILNEEFWKRSEDREFLSDIAWNLAADKNSTMDMPNLKNGMEEKFTEEHPEYFKDDEFYEPPKDKAIDWKNDQILKKLSKLEEKYEDTSLTEMLSEQKALYQEALYETSRKLEELNNETISKLEELSGEVNRQLKNESLEYFLSNLGKRLQSIEEKLSRPPWVTAIIFLVLGFILARILN